MRVSVIGRATTLAMAIGCGVAAASVYYNQPMLGIMEAGFPGQARLTELVPMATQLGFAVGLLLLVPLSDRIERRSLILRQLTGLALSLAAVAMAPDAGLSSRSPRCAHACRLRDKRRWRSPVPWTRRSALQALSRRAGLLPRRNRRQKQCRAPQCLHWSARDIPSGPSSPRPRSMARGPPRSLSSVDCITSIGVMRDGRHFAPFSGYNRHLLRNEE